MARQKNFEKFLSKSRNRLVPSLSRQYKREGVKRAEPREVFGRVVVVWTYWMENWERYPDAPGLWTNEKFFIRTPYEGRNITRRKGFLNYRRFETERVGAQVRILMEECMDREVALRVGDLPPVEWDPSAGVKWTPELVGKLLDHVANGGTYLSFANRVGISRAAVVAIAESEEVAPLVAKAARLGVDAMAEAALEIAGRPCMVEEVIETIAPDGSLVQRNVRTRDQVEARKLAYQSRMEHLSKIAPTRWGAKPEAEASDSMADKILKARKRLSGK